jgi:hypothetical protein
MADEVRVLIVGEDGAQCWFPLPRDHAGLVPEMLPFLDEAMAKLRQGKVN